MFKKFECNVFMDFLKERLLRNRARRLYNISRRFYEKGLPVPGPITYIGPSFGSKRSFYLSYAVNNSDDLENVYKNEMLGDYGDIAAQLGKTLAGWHLAGAVHGNLRWSNILLKKEGGGLRFFLVNLDRARLHGKPDVKGMIKDIVRFYRYAMELGAEEWVDKEFLPNYFASLAGDVRGKINPEVIRKMASRDRKDKR